MDQVQGSETVVPVQKEVAAAAEKLVPQSVVNEIVGREKGEAFERGKAAALAQLQAQQQQPPAQQYAQPQQQTAGIGGMQGMSPDDVRRLIQEQANLQTGQHLANTYAQRLGSADKKRYPDFDEVMASVDHKNIAPIIHLALGVDNTPDVMYDIIKNPQKLAALMVQTQISPQLAASEMHRLSSSIKANQQALDNVQEVSEPLNQLKPSTIKDGGAKTSLDYFKSKYKG